MGWIIGIVILFVVIKMFKGGGGSPKGEKRKFKCDCGANSWIVTDTSYYPDSKTYNFKEWLTCAKCGDSISNDKRI
ncbi:hypothetical protein BCS42_16350 [Crenothrix sp. D3]|nr:hypothetical protein BCS42_16350 [Crenothrix sp. D3]